MRVTLFDWHAHEIADYRAARTGRHSVAVAGCGRVGRQRPHQGPHERAAGRRPSCAQPDRPATDLQVECRAAGIAPAALATLIGGAHLAGDGRIAAPNLARLMKEIHDDTTTMIRAVSAGKASEGETMTARLAAIRAGGLLEAANEIEIARIASLTGVAPDGADSLHRLVMDLHKALNRLAADCSEEILAGAHVFGLQPDDRAAVESFMQGLNADPRP